MIWYFVLADNVGMYCITNKQNLKAIDFFVNHTTVHYIFLGGLTDLIGKVCAPEHSQFQLCQKFKTIWIHLTLMSTQLILMDLLQVNIFTIFQFRGKTKTNSCLPAKIAQSSCLFLLFHGHFKTLKIKQCKSLICYFVCRKANI